VPLLRASVGGEALAALGLQRQALHQHWMTRGL